MSNIPVPAKTHREQAERAMQSLLARLENFDAVIEAENAILTSNGQYPLSEAEVIADIVSLIDGIMTVGSFIDRLDRQRKR